ncbi:hypothetical protein BD770DRAFT_415955 [Pilaira anomala]|nr:hypothetical protein BD770DRAFT_415955 [Pilaira anomala]
MGSFEVSLTNKIMFRLSTKICEIIGYMQGNNNLGLKLGIFGECKSTLKIVMIMSDKETSFLTHYVIVLDNLVEIFSLPVFINGKCTLCPYFLQGRWEDEVSPKLGIKLFKSLFFCLKAFYFQNNKDWMQMRLGYAFDICIRAESHVWYTHHIAV